MSFVPVPKSAKEQTEEKKVARAQKQAEKAEKAKFGAGLEKSGDQPELEEVVMEGEEESGRTKMRKPQRSASRTVTRRL